MTTDPTEAIIPTAAQLVCAVADREPDDVAEALEPLTRHQLYALAVVLAANVADDAPLANYRTTLSPSQQIDTAITRAAEAFETTGDAILSLDRHRNVVDARTVAMAACRLVGLSSPYIGEAFHRDHSTVLHAAGRIGEIGHLRRAALRIADEIGDRGLLGDEPAATEEGTAA